MQRTLDLHYLLGLTVACAVAAALLIWVLHPWLVRYALARPNARSSHTVPTPQGGGIAIIVVVATVIASCALHGLDGWSAPWVWALLAALALLAFAGAVDDIRPLPVLPRLGLQIAVASLLVWTLPPGSRIVPAVSGTAESVALVIGLVWYINLTNFMDGIDWMTVVEVIPITACLVALGLLGIVPQLTQLLPLTLALLGAMIGFAPFNRHVARLFLGDVGSLPIGALVGWLLIVLAISGHVIAALVLPLYYLTDATVTLFRRWLAGEDVSQAHRSHFYQRAVKAGMSVPRVTRDVLLLNTLLAALAVFTILSPSDLYRYLCLGGAALVTVAVLVRFERGG
jgi:UDP-N-acetylmuramyl pentapeptide phosphotransferase/UDP-N-acetylglucosamine-1-phosphate transferase